jgi:hypothetical protein
VYIDGESADKVTSILDPNSGLTSLVVQAPERREFDAGVVDLAVENDCGGSGKGRATTDDAFTYVDEVSVTDVVAPAKLTAGSIIDFHGPDLTNVSAMQYWIMNDDRSEIIELESAGYWAGEDTARAYVGYEPHDDEYIGSDERTLMVGACPKERDWEEGKCRVYWQEQVDWAAPAPAEVTFTPNAGPLAGGNKIRLRGKFLESGYPHLEIKIGGKKLVDKPQSIFEAMEEYDDRKVWTTARDVIEVEAPPSAMAGPVQITVSSEYGSTVARGVYTYQNRPTISSVSPSTVANSGGSLLTLTGTGFGTSGKPAVIIDGLKSPYVTRISDTELTAVVPEGLSTVGAVDVQVSSSQGTGISTPATVTLAAPSAVPSIGTASPLSAKAGASVSLSGSGFGAVGTIGVSVDGVWARVTGSTAVSVTFEVPVVGTPGAKEIVVGAVGGRAVKAARLTVLADDAVTAVDPVSIPSYATGSAATVTITGSGFGSTGKIKVGAATAVTYSATGSGTVISNVAVPTGTVGALPILITPQGATSPIRGAVRVTGPVLSYVGPDPLLRPFLADPTGRTRVPAARAIWRLTGDADGLIAPLLTEATGRPPGVRWRAALELLAEIGPAAAGAVPGLRAAAEHPRCPFLADLDSGRDRWLGHRDDSLLAATRAAIAAAAPPLPGGGEVS